MSRSRSFRLFTKTVFFNRAPPRYLNASASRSTYYFEKLYSSALSSIAKAILQPSLDTIALPFMTIAICSRTISVARSKSANLFLLFSINNKEAPINSYVLSQLLQSRYQHHLGFFSLLPSFDISARIAKICG